MKIVIVAAIFLQVAGIGAKVRPRDLWPVIRRPAWLVRTALAMFVAVPLLAVVLAKTFEVRPVMKAAMLLLSISAAAPLLPGKLARMGSDPPRDAALAAVTTLFAIVVVPFELDLLAAIFVKNAAIRHGAVAQILVTTFLLPLACGMVINATFGERAQRFTRWATTAGLVVVVVAVGLILVAKRATVFPLVRHSLVVVSLFAAGSLLIGHTLGAPDPRDRTSLAIATVTRHPGLALLMATTNFPETPDLMPGILVFALATALAILPYNFWRKRTLSTPPASSVGVAASLQ